MSAFRSWRWSALTIAFGLVASAARAEMITPGSIPNPPSAVSSAIGTAVNPNNAVYSQYSGLGLNFLNPSAITSLNGISVWASVETAGLGGPPGNSPMQSIQYGFANLGFVSPGSLNPTTVSSLSVEIVGNPALSMSVYGVNGLALNMTPIIQSIAGGQVWTFTGPGISSFSAEPTTNTSPWGIAEVSFTPATAPEPSSLILAGLGAMGLAARLGWRRIRRLA